MRLLAPLLCAVPLFAIGCGTTSLPTSSGDGGPPANDFSIAIAPPEQIAVIDAGSSGTFTELYTVTTAQVSGASQAIALAVSGLPAGVSGAFSASTISGAGSSTLTLTVEASAAAGYTVFTVTGTSPSASHTATATVGVCIPGPVTLAVTQTDLYTCTNQEYQATFAVTNQSCAPVSVNQILLTGAIVADAGTGNCSSSGTSTYQVSVSVPIGETKTVLPLTGGPYCCSSTPCPDFTCVESYSFQAITSAGTLTAPSLDATIHLAENAPDGGCAVAICP